MRTRNAETFKRWYAANKERRNAASRKWYAENKDKAKGCMARWAEKNPDKVKHNNRRGRIRRYGISPDDFDRLLSAQNFGCAVCGGVSRKNKGRLSIDHCHKTGVVRGLLCDSCNVAIGMMKDDPERLVKAAQYLRLTPVL